MSKQILSVFSMKKILFYNLLFIYLIDQTFEREKIVQEEEIFLKKIFPKKKRKKSKIHE